MNSRKNFKILLSQQTIAYRYIQYVVRITYTDILMYMLINRTKIVILCGLESTRMPLDCVILAAYNLSTRKITCYRRFWGLLGVWQLDIHTIKIDNKNEQMAYQLPILTINNNKAYCCSFLSDTSTYSNIQILMCQHIQILMCQNIQILMCQNIQIYEYMNI
jgi:hypothetical protein